MGPTSPSQASRFTNVGTYWMEASIYSVDVAGSGGSRCESDAKPPGYRSQVRPPSHLMLQAFAFLRTPQQINWPHQKQNVLGSKRVKILHVHKFVHHRGGGKSRILQGKWGGQAPGSAIGHCELHGRKTLNASGLNSV